MVQSKIFQEGHEGQWVQAGEGVQRQVLGYDEKLMMVKVRFETGGIGAMHNHAHAQVSYVESGVFKMTLGDTVKTIRQGDSYYVPPFTEHGCVCLEAGVLIDAFSPMRWDFITADAENYTL